MAVDFTPLMSLIIAVIPILLLVSVLGYFLGKRRGMFVFLLVATLGLGALFAPMIFVTTSATGTMSPNSGTLATDIPQYFSCTGVTASTACHVNVTVGGAETNVISALTSNADGELSFSLTFTVEGSTTVEVAEGAVGSGTNTITGSYNVINLINLIMPYIILAVTLSIVFGLAGLIGGMVKFGRN